MTRAAETFTTAARAASASTRTKGLRRRLMPIAGTEAMICYRLDDREHSRRRRAGVGAIVSADVLEAMLNLPIGLPVPVRSLTSREWTALQTAPPGAVSLHDGEVTRLAVAPTAVELAVIAARSWRVGLEVAGRFAPFCARAVVLDRRPANLTDARLQAGFYGVGVIVVDGSTAEVLVEPEPFQRQRFTAAGWRFLEDVYRKIR